MLVGIDVGGTFTDGVLYGNGRILESVKTPTEDDNLQETIITVLDDLLRGRKGEDIRRLFLSTTLVTNLLAAGQGDEVALILIPGPGLNLRQLQFFPQAHIIKGATDFHGRITEALDGEEVRELGQKIVAAGIEKVAVVGKFSQRNQRQEGQVEEILLARHPHLKVVKGFGVAGELNFPRRAVTTYYTAMTQDAWGEFAASIKRALVQRGITSPIDILKADGGTMPLEASLNSPCETIFSGPAASVMGALALTMDEQTAVVVDMGGTTTDLALILQGKPLHASRGAMLGGYYSHVRSLALRSLPLGGDSAVRWTGEEISLGPDRLGPAACFGGPVATPTDAVNFLAGGHLGPLSLSQEALARVAHPAGLKTETLAQDLVGQVIEVLKDSIKEMFKSWEEEPAYRIWEIVNKQRVKAQRLVGIGAAAQAFVPILAKEVGCPAFVDHYSPVANALGAAVSRPTLSLQVHADTRQGSYYLSLDGIVGRCKGDLQLADVKDLARKHLRQLAAQRGIGQYADRSEVFLAEQFNMVRGWSTTGKLFDVGIKIAPGVIDDYKGV